MPKVPTDYTKIVIYKLVHKEDFDNANIYIGSTTNFTQRKNQHKSSCLNEKSKEYHSKKYQYIRDNKGWYEWNMIEIEKYPCNDKREAEAKEEYWRTHFNAVLNSKVCISSSEHIKEKNAENCKKYSENNKGKIAENNKKYRDNNKEKIKKYNQLNKTRINQKRREYHTKKREQNSQTV